jgi:hypothetical protein
MATMIPVPDELTRKLRAKANERQIPLNDLVVDILADAVEGDGGESLTLEEVVAQIRATPPNPANFQPATESLADWLARTPADPSFDAEAWNREWAYVESEMKAVDQADDVAEGRG